MPAPKSRAARRLTDEKLRQLVAGASRAPAAPIQRVADATRALESTLRRRLIPVHGMAPGGLVPLVEPIWCYWMEVGGLAAVTTALGLRHSDDPPALKDIPKIDLPTDVGEGLFSWLQAQRDGQRAAARKANYLAHYGLRLYSGRQQPERITTFLDVFHEALATGFQQNMAGRSAPAHRLAQLLRRVHFELARGASSIVDGLPSAQVFPRLQASLMLDRTDFGIAQWLLAHPSIRSALPGHVLVPYPEPWMPTLDRLRQILRSLDSLSVFFHDLAVTSEALVLSIRHGDWANASATSAARWAGFWQLEIVRYLLAYEEVTGARLYPPPGAFHPPMT